MQLAPIIRGQIFAPTKFIDPPQNPLLPLHHHQFTTHLKIKHSNASGVSLHAAKGIWVFFCCLKWINVRKSWDLSAMLSLSADSSAWNIQRIAFKNSVANQTHLWSCSPSHSSLSLSLSSALATPSSKSFQSSLSPICHSASFIRGSIPGSHWIFESFKSAV